jgi:hypothetical protein
MTATALAATNGPTTSPEAIGVYGNGTLLSVANNPDETTIGDTATAADLTVGTLLTAGTLNATVVNDNYSYASVENITAGALLPITATAVTTYCVTNGAGSFTPSYVVIAGLSINDSTPISGTYTSASTVTGITLPGGLSSLTVTIDQETNPSTETVSSSETFNGIDISLTQATTGLTEDIDIASATCGPYNSSEGTPLASGKGLGIGLGAVGLLGGAYATLRTRRRHAAAGIAI